MHTVQRSVLVPYSRSKMFDLVADVEKYPEFMPWCGGATVMDSGAHGMKASIIIRFVGIRKTLTTHNRQDRPGLITLELVDGHVSMLTGTLEERVGVRGGKNSGK